MTCPHCGAENRSNASVCRLCHHIFQETPETERFKQKWGKSTDFYRQISTNKRNSWVLISAIILLLSAIGYLFGETWGHGYGLSGLSIAGILCIVMSLISYYSGSRLILTMSGAKEVSKDEMPQLFNIVEEMSIASGLPFPKIFIIEDSAPNAFATGRDPQHSVIAVTRGLLDKLNRDELQGVIAHEMSHIRNYDIRYATLVGILVGVIALLCDFFLRTLRFSGLRKRDRDKGSAQIQIILFVLGLMLAILAPFFAKMLQMAVSRQREFLADSSGVELTRNPSGLASALEKISKDSEPLEVANRATQHLYIVNPIKQFSMKSSALMSTHPPIEARINILKSMLR
jgi:heat shock protein HtpX